MRFFTAAYGPKHCFAVRGLARSWSAHVPQAPLTIYTDTPEALAGLGAPQACIMAQEPGALDRICEEWGEFYAGNRARLGMFKFSLFREELEAGGGESVCWIDADTLVLDDILPHLREDCICGLEHNRACDASVDFGDGLQGRMADFLMGGLYSLPTSAMPAILQVAQDRPSWSSLGLIASDGDQMILNHAILKFGLPVHRLTDDRRYVFTQRDFVTKDWHPKPGNGALRSIERDGDRWSWNGRRMVLFHFVHGTFDGFAAEQWGSFPKSIRAHIKEWYA